MTGRTFSALLADCRGCARDCAVNRLGGETGVCRLDGQIYISHHCLHFGEEPPISGTNGSGTIFFSSCNLRCVYCQNFQISQPLEHHVLKSTSVDALAERMMELQKMGAHNINFVSPSHFVYPMADAIVLAKSNGLHIPVVYNSNGYDSVAALKRIEGLIDIYLPDFKYLDPDAARRYSKAADYPQIIPAVLEEMYRQCSALELDKNGIARKGLLVRHLVLPGHLPNSRRILKFMANHFPDVPLSIMAQYSPQYRASNYPEINRTLKEEEYDAIVEYALQLGLENAFIQEPLSRESCLPDFDREQVFEF